MACSIKDFCLCRGAGHEPAVHSGSWVAGVLLLVAGLPVAGAAGAADRLPLFDAHIHYSSDAWNQYAPEAVIGILDGAGIRRALVSSTPDEGTVRLHEKAPGRVVPELRPYRSPSDMGSWHRDESVPPYLRERLKRGIYRGIGEFHLHGEDAKSPVVRQVVQMAVEGDLILHAHSDDVAVEQLFAIDPGARVLWAHAGMSTPVKSVGRLLDRHPNLRVELSYRYDVAPGGRLAPEWRALFLRHPDRFLYGSDTWTPSRFGEVASLADGARRWLAELPPDVAERIAYRNGEALFGP